MIALEISDGKFGELNFNIPRRERETGGNEEKWRNQVPFQSVSLVKASCALSLHSTKNSAVLISGRKREGGRIRN